MAAQHLLSLSGHLRREFTATLLMGCGFPSFWSRLQVYVPIRMQLE